MKAMIPNWKNSLILLLTVFIIVQSYYIVNLRNHLIAVGKTYYKLIEWYHTNYVDYKNQFTTMAIAVKYLNQGDTKRAMAWVNLVFDTMPDNLSGSERLNGITENLLEIRGDIYYEMGDYAKAIVDYSNIIEVAEKCGSNAYDVYRIKRAIAYRNLGDTENAMKDFVNAIIFAKEKQNSIRYPVGKLHIPQLPDDLLNYLEMHRDMIEDNDKFEKCVQILSKM